MRRSCTCAALLAALLLVLAACQSPPKAKSAPLRSAPSSRPSSRPARRLSLLKRKPSPTACVLEREPATLTFKVSAQLGSSVVYLGCNVDRRVVARGSRLTVTHYWKVLQAVAGWRVLTHLQGPKQFYNADHVPCAGKHPATTWRPGQIIRDRHSFVVPGRWPLGKVRLFTGLWKGRRRMTPNVASDRRGRVIAATLEVVAAPKPQP